MFSDLNNSGDIKELVLSNTKAYPSVNSPNDGGFNSEQNLRQFVKSIATKPFIIGQTEEDVAKSFKTTPSSFGIYFDSAMFSVDGYIFKIAPQSDISYDTPSLGERGSTFNTQYIQRFASDLCGYGKPDSQRVATKMNEFCFEEYNPEEYDPNSTESWNTLKSLWSSVVDTNTPIGFVRIAYTDGYLTDGLIIDTENSKIKFNSTTINKQVDLISYDASFEVDGKVDPDAIKTYIQSHSMSLTSPFGCVVLEDESHNPTQVNIYYPVFVKTIGSHKYITFEDIYNIQYKHDESAIGYTKNYPSTKSLFVDMDDNAPLNGIYSGSTPECQLVTKPTKLYKYQDMYSVSGGSATRKDFGTGISDIAETADFDLGQFFNKVTFENVKTIQSTDSSAQKVPYVKNTLSYYCLKVPDSECIQINNQYVPIAFMTSEGSLCPNGLIYTDTANSFGESYPIEGYVHYIYRKVADSIGTQISQVTFDDVITYIRSGTNAYSTYIAPAISVYLSLCYSSLMQYTVAPTFSVATDYLNDQASGCGIKLSSKAASNPNVTTDDFATYYDYTYTSYNYSGSGTGYTTETSTSKIRYNKDKTSDNWKIHDSIIKGKDIVGFDITYSYSPTDELSNNSKYLRFDDPANYMSRCSGADASTDTVPFKLQFIIQSGGRCALDTGSSGYINFSNTKLDQYLMPSYRGEGSRFVDPNKLLADINSLTTVSLSGTGNINDSLINSLNFRTKFNTWIACFDYVVDVVKDSQGYLCGKNIDEPTIYDGLRFFAKLPQDVTKDELFLFRLGVACTASIEDYNNETCLKYPDSTSGNSVTRRQSYIHISKIYGDNYKSFSECVSEITREVIEEALQGYDLSDFPTVYDALVDHINYGDKNQIEIVGNRGITYTENTAFKPNINSNVVFKYYRNRNVTPYRDYVEVYLDTSDSNNLTQANADSDFSIPIYCSGGDMCLTGCPSDEEHEQYGSSITYFADISPLPGDSAYLQDFGYYENPVHGVLKQGNRIYTIHIKAGTPFESGQKLIFEPMLCYYTAYKLTDDAVAHVPNNSELAERIEELRSEITYDDDAFINTINRPAKNLLCRYSGSQDGDILIKFSKPLERDDYELYFGTITCSNTSITSLTYAFLDENRNELQRGTIQTGNDIVKHISSSTSFNNPPAYLWISCGWNANHQTANGKVIVSDMMLCKKVEWDITDKYVEGLGNLADNFKSLCDRVTKNKLYSHSFPTYMVPRTGGDTQDIRLEFTLPMDDYVLYIKSCQFEGYICLVDSHGNESMKYPVENLTWDVVLRFDALTMKDTYNMTDVHHLKMYITNPSIISPGFQYAMLCTEAEWLISQEFVPSVSSLSYESYLSQLDSIKTTMGQLIDVSSKNMYPGGDVTGTSTTYIDMMTSDIEFRTSESYTLHISDFTSSVSNGPYDYILVYDDTGSESDWVVSDPISLLRHGYSNMASSTFMPESSTIKRIRVYGKTDHTTSGDIGAENIMICLKEFYELTERYVPYSPSNAELYDMINNL